MPAVREILLGHRTGDHLLLTVRGRLFPDSVDAPWLWASLTVRAAGFGCRRDGNLHTDELRRFRAALEELHESGGAAAELATEDEWLTIGLSRDGDGSVAARVRVHDDGPPPAELRCGLSDLTPAGLMTTIESLAAVERSYP